MEKNSPRPSVRPPGRETTQRRVCQALDRQDAREPSVRVVNKRAGQVRTNVLQNLCEMSVRPSIPVKRGCNKTYCHVSVQCYWQDKLQSYLNCTNWSSTPFLIHLFLLPHLTSILLSYFPLPSIISFYLILPIFVSPQFTLFLIIIALFSLNVYPCTSLLLSFLYSYLSFV